MGAASAPKPGAAALPAGDFAALVEDANDGHDTPAMPDTPAATNAPPTDKSADVDAVDALQAKQLAAHTFRGANLAGFFKSLRNHGSAEAALPTGKALSVVADAPPTTPDADQDDEQSSPSATVVVAPELPPATPVPVALGLPGMPATQPALDTASQNDTHDTDLVPSAQAAESALVTPTMTAPPSAQVPVIVPELGSPTSSSPPETPESPAQTMSIAPSEIANQLIAAQLEAVPAAPETPGEPRAQAIAEARAFVETLSAELPRTRDLSAVASRLFPQPRAVSLTVDAADTTAAAPKIRIAVAAALGEAASPRAERVTVLPRLISPTFSTPHGATPAMVATAVTTEMMAAAVADTHIADQIVQSMRLQWLQGGGEATIELNPNALGKVQVQVRVEHGVVTATMAAETPLVREWMTSHRDELTQNLAQQGLRLDKLVIAETAKESPARDARDSRQPSREPARQRRAGHTPESDIFELNDPQETT